MPGQRQPQAHVDDQPARGKPHLAVLEVQGHRRAALEAEAPVALHRVGARQRQVKGLRRVQRPEVYPQHAVVL